MAKTLIIQDGVYGPELRDYALSLDYRTVHYGGHDYKGVSLSKLKMEPILEHMLGCPVEIEMQFFRSHVRDQGDTAYIHADSVCSTYASVLYLSEVPGNGTAFYRHKATGWERLPRSSPRRILEQLHSECDDTSKWEMTMLVPGKLNRMIVYPTDLFHSRHPRNVEGVAKEDGRIVWCSFFREVN